jgi:hypothetical protein
MSKIKDELIGIAISGFFMPLLVPAYITYYLIFKDYDSTPKINKESESDEDLPEFYKQKLSSFK